MRMALLVFLLIFAARPALGVDEHADHQLLNQWCGTACVLEHVLDQGVLFERGL